MHIGLYVKDTFFLSDFNETLIFSTDIRKMPGSMRTDRHADVTTLIVPFCVKDKSTVVLSFCHLRSDNLHHVHNPPQCHHMSLIDFVVFPPGCCRCITDF
jgi:hypothetical protein